MKTLILKITYDDTDCYDGHGEAKDVIINDLKKEFEYGNSGEATRSYSIEDITNKALNALPGSKEKCKHNGRKRSDPLGGFYCVECGTFVNKKN